MIYIFEQIAINSTAKKKPEPDDRLHYIGLEHLDSENLFVSRYGADATPAGEKLLMKKGDVLFGKRRAYQKKVAIAPFDGIFSAHGMVLRPKEDVVCKEYFPFFLSSETFLNEAIRISVGSLSPTINWGDLKKLKFELPPIEEQRRLAELLWAAYELKESYKKLLFATDEMVKAKFVEMFGNEPKEKLGAYIKIVRGVSYKPQDVHNELSDDSFALLRSNNIFEGEINTTELVFVDKSRVSKEQVLLIGDILMCASNGSKHLVGKSALNVKLEKQYTFGTFCLVIRCNDLPFEKYLNQFLQTKMYREQIDLLSCGSNILNIKPEHIKNLLIPIPPIDLQQKFVEFVHQADASKAALQEAIEKLKKVMKSLLP